MGEDKEGPSVMHRTAVVAPEAATLDDANEMAQNSAKNSPMLSGKTGKPDKGSKPRRLPHMNMPAMPKINMPNVNLPSVNLPHMINIQSYVPTIRPPAFLKEIYTLPVQMGDQLNHEIIKVGNNINKLIDRSEVYLSKPPPMPEFDNCSIFSTVFSMANYIFNLSSNIGAAYVLWFEPDSTWWFWLTVNLMVIPTLIVNGFSLYWYWQRNQSANKDESTPKRPRISKCWWILRIFMHLILLGPFFRYFDTLYYGIKSRKSKLQRVNIKGPYCPWPKQRKELKRQGEYYNLLLHEERDQSILELMYSFMQDGPQLILQLYILARRPPESKTESDYIITVLVQIFSSLTSLFTLSWSLASYQRALRYAMTDKPNLSVGGIVTIFWWQTLTVAARVVALALFATSFKLEVFGLVAGHWALMTIWILFQKTNFCGAEDGRRRPVEEFFYNLVMGWVYVFTMINVKGSPTRWKYTAYYLLILAENATMISLWFLMPDNDPHWYHLPAFVGTWTAFFVGLAFMMLYYKKYHPDLIDGKMPKKSVAAKLM